MSLLRRAQAFRRTSYSAVVAVVAVLALLGCASWAVAGPACTVPDAPARVVHLVQPGYDQLAFEVGAAGTLRVHVTVSKSGRAAAAAVPGAHPFAGLDHYAISAALASTYSPARRHCEPVQSTLIVPMVFPPKGFKVPQRVR